MGDREPKYLPDESWRKPMIGEVFVGNQVDPILSALFQTSINSMEPHERERYETLRDDPKRKLSPIERERRIALCLQDPVFQAIERKLLPFIESGTLPPSDQLREIHFAMFARMDDYAAARNPEKLLREAQRQERLMKKPRFF